MHACNTAVLVAKKVVTNTGVLVQGYLAHKKTPTP